MRQVASKASCYSNDGIHQETLGHTLGPILDTGGGLVRSHRQRDIGFGATILVFSLILLPIGGARASVSCGIQDPTFSGRGYDPSGYQPRGSEAEVDIRGGDLLCENGNGPDTFSTSWVMLANQASTGYAQVGHMFKNFGSVNHRFFYEYDVGPGGLTRVFWGDPVFGNHHNFRASRQTGDGHVHFTVEDNNPPGSVPGETNFDPLEEWNGTISWWSSEVAHIGSDVPGTTSSKTNYEFVHHKNSNENWQLQNWNLVANPTACYFSVNEVTSDSHFRSWTNDPNHACD